MNLEPDSTHGVEEVEARLRSALKQEAAYWQDREPVGLGQRCRMISREQCFATPVRLVWTWGVGCAAAAMLVIGILIMRTPCPVEFADAPAVVRTLTDTSALYAALPRIPSPDRPPAPVHLVADTVMVIPSPGGGL